MFLIEIAIHHAQVLHNSAGNSGAKQAGWIVSSYARTVQAADGVSLTIEGTGKTFYGCPFFISAGDQLSVIAQNLLIDHNVVFQLGLGFCIFTALVDIICKPIQVLRCFDDEIAVFILLRVQAQAANRTNTIHKVVIQRFAFHFLPVGIGSAADTIGALVDLVFRRPEHGIGIYADQLAKAAASLSQQIGHLAGNKGAYGHRSAINLRTTVDAFQVITVTHTSENKIATDTGNMFTTDGTNIVTGTHTIGIICIVDNTTGTTICGSDSAYIVAAIERAMGPAGNAAHK